MYRKIFAILIVFSLLFGLNTHAIAAGNTIENGDFESKSYLWSQGVFDENAPHLGAHCFAFSSPATDLEDSVLHATSYIPKLSLKANTVYSFKLYIKTNLFESSNLLPECRVILPSENNNISIYISNISDVWQQVSVLFMVDKTDSYELTLLAESFAADATIFIDDIKISSVDFTPYKMDIVGHRNLTIPEYGEISYIYSPAVTDINGHSVSIQTAHISVESELPKGTFFSEERGEIIVSSEAQENSRIKMKCTPLEGSTTLSSAVIEIELSKNLIINGSFDDVPLYNGWDIESAPFSVCKENGNQYASISSSHSDGAMFSGLLIPKQSFVLFHSKMYVFRASLRSETPYDTRQIQTQISLPNENGAIHIKIEGVFGKNWTDVIAAFYVPVDGIYTIQIDFSFLDEQPIYIDSLSIQPEEKKPSAIYFEMPSHISIPKNKQIELPLSYTVFDQEGSFCKENVQFFVEPETEGIKITDDVLSIMPNITENNYTIKATLADDSSVNKYRVISVTNESTGDGSFEITSPGQMWATAPPSLLHYVSTYNDSYPTNGSLLARLTMNGSVSAMISDSVSHYQNEKSYVFEADMKITVPDIETIVTVLIDNALSDSFDDNLVVGQFSLSNSMQHVQKLFTPSAPITGRLMIAFNTPETHDQQVILLDNISICDATVEASGVNISGLPYLDKNIVGKYRFNSNFNAIDSSTCRWLFSNSSDGIFMPIEGENGNTLSITADMIGKYVKFEVTPISLSGPVVGASMTSSAIRVGEPIPVDSSVYIPETDLSIMDETQSEEFSTVDTIGSAYNGMTVINLHKFSILPRHHFLDLKDHWAREEIEILTAAGIVQGRGNGVFEPQALITRAEFSAFLARAFALAPIYYEGQFDDVKYYNWYAGAVAVVTKYGIAQGTSLTTFSPELPITREEMAVMIMRAYRKAGAHTGESNLNYKDLTTISSWAKQDVGESNSIGLLQGLPDGTFQPKQNATRAEAAVCIQRMLTIISCSS